MFILELARQEAVLEYCMWYCAQVSACRQRRVLALSNGLFEDGGIIQLDVGEICGRRAAETATCFPNLQPMNV